MPQASEPFLSNWEAQAGLADCVSQTDMTREVPFGFPLSKSEPEKGAHLPTWPSQESWLRSPGMGHLLPAACPPLLGVEVEDSTCHLLTSLGGLPVAGGASSGEVGAGRGNDIQEKRSGHVGEPLFQQSLGSGQAVRAYFGREDGRFSQSALTLMPER